MTSEKLSTFVKLIDLTGKNLLCWSSDWSNFFEFESKNDIRFEKLKTELDNLKKENEELKRSDAKKIESSGKTTETISKTEIPEMIYKNKDDIYILCTFDNQDTTYIFSDSKAIFKLMNKLDVIPYSVSFNNAYIVATRDNIVLTIYR